MKHNAGDKIVEHDRSGHRFAQVVHFGDTGVLVVGHDHDAQEGPAHAKQHVGKIHGHDGQLEDVPTGTRALMTAQDREQRVNPAILSQSLSGCPLYLPC